MECDTHSFPTRRSSDLSVYTPVAHDDPDLSLVHAQEAWTAVGGEAGAGAGVKVAVIDSGIDHTHPCFEDRKSTRLNSSHLVISYAIFCLKNKYYISQYD